MSHVLGDTERGTGRIISSNNTDAESVNANWITDYNSNGFSIGSLNALNSNSKDFASWTFREAPGFFDIVTYTGTGGPQNIPHSLGVKPGMMIVKSTSHSSLWTHWAVYHQSLTANWSLKLNEE